MPIFDLENRGHSKLESLLWLIVALIILFTPAILFLVYKLWSKLSANFKRKSKISAEQSAEMGNVVARYRNSIPNVSDSIRAEVTPEMGQKKMSSSEQSSDSLDIENKAGLTPGIQSNRRISACCLHELKLMDIGPLPYDHSLIEEERQREIEKKLKSDI